MRTTDHDLISSRRNPRIQRIKKLLSNSQFRKSEQAFVLEGVRLVKEAIKSGWQISELLIDERVNFRSQALVREAFLAGTSSFLVSESVLADITDTETPQGIVAVIVQQDIPLPPLMDLILILDAIRDPGNVGTILRTANAVGVNTVLITPDTADPFSPKVLRAGMGAQLTLPLREMDWPEIAQCVHGQSHMKTLLADIHNGQPLWEVDLSQPVALIISNETAGPSIPACDLSDGIITIPMPGDSESLNAAIAASLLMYEVLRQRR
ncbi:MAG: RNA methyltransferase [Anaerolineaceae bacterium]|nr:RNA methyltransferase [Anaerolineaceae bacterium]MBN2677137.1 RNA methyltransferase [Anaerolineaceae bacterium]